MDADGSEQTNLTNSPLHESHPVWSPDGSKILFVRMERNDYAYEIYIMDADGSEQTNLTNSPGNDDSPAWSPGGSKIAFCSDRDGLSEIYIMDADGSNQTNLPNSPGFESHPMWLPLEARGVSSPPPALTPSPAPIPAPAPVPAPAPAKIHSTGFLDIMQTWMADLDEGEVGVSVEADIWFHAVTATERYVEPRNGAKIAIVGTTAVGRDGCAAASLSTSRININDLPVGIYFCVLTNQGRYCQFHVNATVGPSPGTLSIGYTTWD
jgi:TolB protein